MKRNILRRLEINIIISILFCKTFTDLKLLDSENYEIQYNVNEKEYYFFDETDFDGKHAICAREKTEFKKGDESTYRKFLQDTVFPSTELSLALAIGYSAVVVARLNGEYDLRNSYC